MGIDGLPRFADWQAIKAQELLVGRITRQPDDRVKVEFRLWDVFGEYQMPGQQYSGDSESLNRIGHMISADIYQRITFKKRAFD